MNRRVKMHRCLIVAMIVALALVGCGDNPADSGDTTPPAQVVDLEVVALTENAVTLAWTAPGNDGKKGQAAHYDLRYSHSSTYVQWETAARADSLSPPQPAGTRETHTLRGLDGGGNYFFALATLDEAMNQSEISNWARANTDDVTPPSQITDLAATVISHKCVELAWTAPGDDGNHGTAAGYELYYSTEPILEPFLDRVMRFPAPPAPLPGGSSQTVRVDVLQDQTSYTFGLRTRDDGPNLSRLSNTVTVTTPADEIPPDAVTDLTVAQVTASAMILSWTAPGDDGDEDPASGYDLRYATVPLTTGNWEAGTPVAAAPQPRAPGSAERYAVYGLDRGTHYYFGLRTRDERENESPLSNIASGEFDLEPDGVWHVQADGSGDTRTVQAAIDLASAGDLILVGPGTYGDPFDYRGKELVVESTDGDEATILDASDFEGESFILAGPGTTLNTALTGFTVTGLQGGTFESAIRIDKGGLSLENCTIHDNDRYGLVVGGGKASIRGNRFTENGHYYPKTTWVGAIYVGPGSDHGAEVLIENNTFTDNRGGTGSVLSCQGDVTRIVFRGNQVRGNWSNGPGGAVRVAWNIGHALIEDNVFEANRAESAGGAIILWNLKGRAEVRRNLFVANESTIQGYYYTGRAGAAISVMGAAGVIENNTFVMNEEGLGGCNGGSIGVQIYPSVRAWNWDIRRNIIASNVGGGINCVHEMPGVRVGDNLFFANGPCAELSCTLEARPGNIEADPLFCNPTAGDYRVAADSPALAIGAGAYLTPGCPATGGSASVWSLPELTRHQGARGD